MGTSSPNMILENWKITNKQNIPFFLDIYNILI